MFGLSHQEFYGLLIALLLMWAFTCMLLRWKRGRKCKRMVGERGHIEPQKPKCDASRSALWVCPQCFQTTGRPGVCPSVEHEGTPIQLQPADQSKLQYYRKMRRLIGSEIDD